MRKVLLFTLLLSCFSTLYAQKWQAYPTYEDYVHYMQEMAENNKEICRLDTIGYSVNGRLLLCLRISYNNDYETYKPKFFFSAAMHGNELTGAVILLQLIDSLLTDTTNIADKSLLPVIYICPYANPDGTWDYAMRYNANFVDLNRNYPDIRTGKNSDGEVQQPETAAFIKYQNKEKFNLSCNLHTGSEVFNYPWDSFRTNKKKHADDLWFKTLGSDFVARLNDESGSYFTAVNKDGVVEGGDWYVIYGSRQDWSTYFAHCREVTLEVSSEYTPMANTLSDYWHKLKNSLFTFFDYCNQGFCGVVTDSLSSLPLGDVMIEIGNYDKDSSEVFSTDSGYYFRGILQGNYEVTFSKKGYYSKTLSVFVADGLSKCNVQLVPIKTAINNEGEKLPIIYKIYPTMAKAYLYVEVLGQKDEDLSYEIVDMKGTIFKKEQIKTDIEKINISTFPLGTYIVNIYGNNLVIGTKKFIKE